MEALICKSRLQSHAVTDPPLICQQSCAWSSKSQQTTLFQLLSQMGNGDAGGCAAMIRLLENPEAAAQDASIFTSAALLKWNLAGVQRSFARHQGEPPYPYLDAICGLE